MLAAGDERNLGSSLAGGSAPDHSVDAFKEKLDRAESKKMQLEEKLEAVTASWKRERRQLNSEIEKFRLALTRTSATAKDSEGLNRRLEETIRYSKQLELKCEEQALEREAERDDFESRIQDLEGQIVEWIERSHNTHRSTQSTERKMEVELTSHKRAAEIESEKRLRSQQVRGNQTQRVLEGEIERLKKELKAAISGKPSLVRRLLGLGQ